MATGCGGKSSTAGPDAGGGTLEGSDAGTACVPAPVYALVSNSGTIELETFDPATSTFGDAGAIVCPGDDALGSPNSVVAVDHAGRVYVEYGTCGAEHVYRIDPSSMSCIETPFGRNVNPNYNDCLMSMAFVPTPGTQYSESLLFLASGLEVTPAPAPMTTPYYLGRVSDGGTESVVGPLAAPAQAAQSQRIPLAGSPDGSLYVDYNQYANNGLGTDIGVVNLSSATATMMWQVSGYPTTSEANWYRMFAYWRGAFYLFPYSSQTASGEVVRFQPETGAVDVIAQNPRVLAVGAQSCTP